MKEKTLGLSRYGVFHSSQVALDFIKQKRTAKATSHKDENPRQIFISVGVHCLINWIFTFLHGVAPHETLVEAF